jgi:hypothetical protein
MIANFNHKWTRCRDEFINQSINDSGLFLYCSNLRKRKSVDYLSSVSRMNPSSERTKSSEEGSSSSSSFSIRRRNNNNNHRSTISQRMVRKTVSRLNNPSKKEAARLAALQSLRRSLSHPYSSLSVTNPNTYDVYTTTTPSVFTETSKERAIQRPNLISWPLKKHPLLGTIQVALTTRESHSHDSVIVVVISWNGEAYQSGNGPILPLLWHRLLPNIRIQRRRVIRKPMPPDWKHGCVESAEWRLPRNIPRKNTNNNIFSLMSYKDWSLNYRQAFGLSQQQIAFHKIKNS